MKRYILFFCLFFTSCVTLEYPITTRYKEKHIKQKYARIPKDKKHKTRNHKNIKRDIIIFSVGTILLWNYIEHAK